MKIAFYAPLKSPDHPVPSGDRLMARQLLAALKAGGSDVSVASHLRTFHAAPEMLLPDLKLQAQIEVERLSHEWELSGPPDLWFCYHPYYKAPDLLGPPLARRFSLPYVTAEASYSERRNIGQWAHHQEKLKELIKKAAVNLYFTERDRAGLTAAAPTARLGRLWPFIEAGPFLRATPAPEDGLLVTVAMMRAGDKTESYSALSEALQHVRFPDWRLVVVGGGEQQHAIKAMFSKFPRGRIEWLGELSRTAVVAQLSRAAVFVWPGRGEAYGLAYLEAQACGLPIVAERVAGVPEAVSEGRTGILTPAGDARAFANAIDTVLANGAIRQELSKNARDFVERERSLPAISKRLTELLVPALEFPF